MALLLVIGGLAYFTSLDAAFVFDDRPHIIDREDRLRDVFPLEDTLSIRHRPLVTLSLTINYQISEMLTGDGLDPRAYHVFNLAIHLLVGLTLFSVARYTIARAARSALWRRRAEGLALVIALLWLVHPLTTQAVTYTIQRAEAMAALFYLLVIYALLRSDGAHGVRRWTWLAAMLGACVLGWFSKEIIITAPVVAFLYDRAVLAGSFGQAIRRRWLLYGPLLVVGGVVGVWKLLNIAEGGGSAGFGVPTHTATEYALNQPRVILHYLRLAIWPVGLTLDYGWAATDRLAVLLPGWIVVTALLGATLWALWARPVIGTLGAAFFLMLAPTSSIVPLADLAMEHRMYLPLAVVVALVVVGVRRVLERTAQRAAPRLGMGLTAAAAVALGTGTAVRNLDYATPISIWRDTAAKAPHNPRAHSNLGSALFREGERYRQAGDGVQAQVMMERAERAFRKARAIESNAPRTDIALAKTLRELGRLDEAIHAYRRIVGLTEGQPKFQAEALHGLGVSYGMTGQFELATEALQRAVEVRPSRAAAHADLAKALMESGDLEAAVSAMRRAVRRNAWNADWQNTLGMMLAMSGDVGAALPHFERAVELDPTHADARGNLRRARGMLQGSSAR